MNVKKSLKSWKTTTIGAILIILSNYYAFFSNIHVAKPKPTPQEPMGGNPYYGPSYPEIFSGPDFEVNLYLYFGALFLGIILLFIPDTFFTVLKDKLGKTSLNNRDINIKL